MRTYTQEEVDKFIRATISETSEGFLEWIKEETDIFDKDTNEVLTNAEIRLKPTPSGILENYIYPRLVKHGIKFI